MGGCIDKKSLERVLKVIAIFTQMPKDHHVITPWFGILELKAILTITHLH